MAEMRAGFDRGLKRRANPAYAALTRRIHKLRREIDALRAAGAGEALIRPLRDEIRERQRERRSVPAVDPMDLGFRRLRYCRYADDVRHITRCWIPFAERRGLEDMTPGPTAYPAAKAKGDCSMPSKRERSEDADDPVPQGPRDTVRTA